jgi:hypothetical protein
MPHAQLHQSWKKLIDSLLNPLPMRPGSISQQRSSVRREDGSIHYKGPYPLYTFKKEAKTVSRILDERELPVYRQAVENFHEFLAVVEQIKALGLALAEAEKPDLKKTPGDGRKGKSRRG